MECQLDLPFFVSLPRSVVNPLTPKLSGEGRSSYTATSFDEKLTGPLCHGLNLFVEVTSQVGLSGVSAMWPKISADWLITQVYHT